MKIQQKESLFLGIILVLSGFFSLFTTVCLAEELPRSLSEIQERVNAKGANWTVGKTSVFGLPAEQLCGSVLHPEAKKVEAPPDLLESAFPSSAPAALDWRNYNGHDWTTPIRNQNPCGSCYIFGTSAAAEAAMKVQAGTYGYLADPDLAEQFVLSCGGFNCTSGYSGDALDYLINPGSTDEACLPYTALDTTPCTNRCSNWADRIHQIEDWDHPGGYPNWYPTVAQIKTAILTYGPVSTYMKVYVDFRDYYTGGVYEYTFGSYLGGHTVTLVGWDDSQQCWIAKNSWGTGWGESGWFRIKWGEVSIEQQTEFVEAGLPNLTDYPHTGWSYSLVPRNTTGTTWASCPLPATLNGNQNTTYLNFAGINNGSEPAPPFGSRFYLDGIYVWWANWGKIAASGGFYAPDLGTLSVKGGRHTLGIHLDINDQVWETNESDYSYPYDNIAYRQFIWSPYGLSDDSPITRSAPPIKNAWGDAPTSWYNNDGFSFVVQQEEPKKWWSAVGILPYSSGADYDLRLWDIGNYTGSEGGFGGDYLEWSSYGNDVIDFVIVNDNEATAGTYYAGVINDNQGTGDFRIEEDTSLIISPRPGTAWNGPYSKSGINVLDIYEIYLYAGEYYFYLDQTAGTCDLGITLYDDETVHAQKNEYMAGGYANSNGDGQDESFQVTIPDDGWHGLVVWKADSSDYNKAHNYRIAVGPPSITVTAPNGGETWNAWTWQWITWDPFGYIDDYVNIEISRDGGSSWSSVANSQVNDGSYQWYVNTPASTQCRIRITSTTHGSYTDTSDANFTIYYDDTPPTPNPMTWATEPYETSTSSISMVATTASDPTPPISYFFDFTSSLTGGSGGTDSVWQSSTSYTDSGLSTNHQYGYRVRARDNNNNQTGYSSISYDYTDIETPSGITFGTIKETTIQAKSTNTPSGLTRGSSGLIIYNVTKGSNSGWKQDNNYWTSASLSPNTQYGFRAMARNGDGDKTLYSTSSYRYTLANPPGVAAFNNITETSIQANWTANGNPTGTQYFCENTTAGTNSGWTTNTYWNSTGLNCDTIYSFRVKARNGDGVQTAWKTLGAQKTKPCPDICECDLNHDGTCNILDWSYFIEDWGRTDCNDPEVECECDLNHDGSCNILDWSYFIEDWGRSDCPIP